ncbi:MAG: tellurite resistance ADP-ribose pyrophosphatase TrgB [Pararhodobacter sp.]
MPADAIFLFGTLRYAPLLAAVSGANLRAEPAALEGYRIVHAVAPSGKQQAFPCLEPAAGSTAQGLIIRPQAEARARLDAYERVFGYDLHPVQVLVKGVRVEASVYGPRPGLWTAGAPWSLEDWSARDGALTVATAAEVMALLEAGTPDEAILHRYAMLQGAVASRLRARATPTPATLRHRAAPGDVEVLAYRRPYTWFFGIDEADLRFRRFRGDLSAPVNRAGFVSGDAVTVLPYDPVRDAVMLIEQFRFGPFCRGDTNPWSLEAVAGRIDAGESPEQAARREAVEETGLRLGALHAVGRYYASPGAVTEYLYSYIGIADLPQSAAGVSGVEAEAEDIRAHVVPFARVEELMTSGEIENAPLLISLQWLMLHRAGLRPPGGT